MGSKETKTVTIGKKKQKIGGASKKDRQHVHHAHKCLRQFDRTSKNKDKAWKAHLANHPNDKVAAANIKRVMGAF